MVKEPVNVMDRDDPKINMTSPSIKSFTSILCFVDPRDPKNPPRVRETTLRYDSGVQAFGIRTKVAEHGHFLRLVRRAKTGSPTLQTCGS
jgi:hypothetical protein